MCNLLNRVAEVAHSSGILKSGETLRSPYCDGCSGNEGKCPQVENPNFRRVGLFQSATEGQSSPLDKFYRRAQNSLEIIQAARQ